MQLDFWLFQVGPYHSLAVLYSALVTTNCFFVLFVFACHMTFSCIYPKCAFLPCRVHNGNSVSNKLQWQVLKAIHQCWI